VCSPRRCQKFPNVSALGNSDSMFDRNQTFQNFHQSPAHAAAATLAAGDVESGMYVI
jgi:hypothetical protein